ncbi:MAG: MarC family protein [Chlamydiales bacterium]
MTNFISTAFILFLVINSLGELPNYLPLLQEFEPAKRRWIIIRELFFALCLMFVFFFAGVLILKMLGISRTTAEIAGGLILFLIAIRMIFAHENEQSHWRKEAHFFVPIATPIFAGPSLFSVITIFSQSDVPTATLFLAMLAGWFLSCIVYVFADPIHRVIRNKGLLACQRLMGLLTALISVQVFLQGIKDLIHQGI